jgi:hypothetical protein
VEVWKVKTLFLRLCFFGSFETWREEFKVENGEPTLFITRFAREMGDIAETTRKANPDLYETARKSKEAKGKGNIIGSFYALYLQEYELRIVETVMNVLMEETDVMKHPTENKSHVGVYEYDGIKLLTENVGKYDGGKDALLLFINKKTKELTGFDLLWVEKELDEYYDIDEWIQKVEQDEKIDKQMMEEELLGITSKLDDAGVIEVIKNIYPDHFVYSNGEWFGWTGEKWENNDVPLRICILYRVPEYWQSILTKWKVKFPIDTDFISSNGNHVFLKNATKEIETFIHKCLRDNNGQNGCVGQGKHLLRNDKLEFDANKNLIGFNNGVYDNSEECFRPFQFDDHVTWSCGFDFVPSLKGMKYQIKENNELVMKTVSENLEQAKFDEIKDIFEKIFPDDKVRKLVWIILASGLVGIAIEKFIVFNGSGRNGKGLISELMKWCLNDYFQYVSPTILTENQKSKTSAQANPELHSIHKKRLVVSKEPSSDLKIHNNVVKDLTGGGEIRARTLYKNDARVSLCLTKIMECNYRPRFKETPVQADAERLLDIHFESFFTDDKDLWDNEKHVYPLVAEYKDDDWKNAHRNAFINILIEYLTVLKNQGYIINRFVPESVKLRGLKYLQDSNEVHLLFTSLYRKCSEILIPSAGGKERWPSLAAIARKIRESSAFSQLPPSIKNRTEMKAEEIKKFFKTNLFYKNSVFLDTHTKQYCLKDWEIMPEETDDEEISDEGPPVKKTKTDH